MRTEPKVRWMRGADSLEVAEGRVAFDVVLLLEAVELGWVNVHSRKYLKKRQKTINVKNQTTCCAAERDTHSNAFLKQIKLCLVQEAASCTVAVR